MLKIRNTTMDIFKAFACIGVVWMHIRFPGEIGTFVRALGCFGVPLFFCVSGYWLSSKEIIDPQNIFRKLKHIVYLIIGAETAHIIFSIILNDLMNPVRRSIFLEKYFSQGWIENWVITNAPPVYAHLWFLYALAVIYLLILLFVKNKKTLHYLAVSVPFLLLGIALMQEFSFLRIIRSSIPLFGTTKTFYWAHTILFRAIPWFLIGVIFYDYGGVFKKIPFNLPVLIILIVLSETIAAIESLFFNTAQFYIGNFFATIFIMITCVKYPQISCKPLEYIGGKLFTWVYICHVAVYKTLGYLTAKLHIASLPITGWLMPIVGLTVSIIIAVLIENAKEQFQLFKQHKN